jgi:peptidoglycan/LPS O-acetylase OafA/YrhL
MIMRKHYLDNIRWITVAVVVLYHVFYMYNAEGVVGVVGKITNMDVQYQDLFQYIVYPWIMVLLFIVSGISSRLYLEKHTAKEFVKSRTAKCLVPVTIGLLAFQFIQGYVNAGLSEAIERTMADMQGSAPTPVIYFVCGIICIFSGIGVLWYIQMLWLFSLALLLVRLIDKDRLWKVCAKTPVWVIPLLVIPVFGAAQIGNTPMIVVYRFGLYFFVFLLGYFIFSHEEVIERMKKWFLLFLIPAIGLGAAFCIKYFGENYADNPIYRSPLFIAYGFFASMAMIACMARFGDVSNKFTQWMSKRSFGLYVFHYLGISAVGLYLAKPGLIPPLAAYLLSTVAGFGGSYLLYEIISRIPVYRWMVLGISKKKKKTES